jgi:hypothetical protein
MAQRSTYVTSREAFSGQGADHRQPFSRNRAGKTARLGLDGLCAREVAAAGSEGLVCLM